MVLASNISVKFDGNGNIETDRKVSVRVERQVQSRDEKGVVQFSEKKPYFASLQDVLFSFLRDMHKAEVKNLELQGRCRTLEEKNDQLQNQIDNIYKWLCELDPSARSAIERQEKIRAELLNADAKRDAEAETSPKSGAEMGASS